ncbi:MAG: hypothetical protein ACI3VB_05075 [Oscillospiraceae bacterium]
MTDIENILETVRETLADAGIKAVTEFPAGLMKRYTAPIAAVGFGGVEILSAGLLEYIGEKADGGGGTFEVYGRRMELEAGIGIYSPRAEFGAQGCLDMAGRISEALRSLPTGIKVRSFVCEEIEFDGKTDMFLLKCRLKCVCFLYAERRDETEILNFTLKGVPV